MILTKAFIVSLPTEDDNHFKVRVPLYEDTTNNEAIFDALLCSSPGIYYGYNVGDCVYVHFEDDQQDVGVILGKLFTEVPKEESAYVLAGDLKVLDNAELPNTTKLGSYSVDDFTKLYNSVLVGSGSSSGSGGGGGGSDYEIEKLKRVIGTVTQWVIEQTPDGQMLNIYRKRKVEPN